jgi:predicted nucleic acid-binding protein
MNESRTFVDTNVLVYAVDRQAASKRARALTILVELGSSLVVSTQVIQEFYVAATRKLSRRLPIDEAERRVEELLQTDVVVIDPRLIRQAISLSKDHQLSFWDALIVQAAQSRGCTRLLTEDLQDGRRFGTLRVEDPFAGL